jgi:hypothetical protein
VGRYAELIFFRIATTAVSCDHVNEPWGFCKMFLISILAARLLGSQEGSCSMEMVPLAGYN